MLIFNPDKRITVDEALTLLVTPPVTLTLIGSQWVSPHFALKRYTLPLFGAGLWSSTISPAAPAPPSKPPSLGPEWWSAF